jgi:hypothetical protein
MLSMPPLKRLLMLLVILACVIVFGPFMNSQFRHMRQVQQHIASIGPAWIEFRARNGGFQDIRLVPFTGGDGTFGVFGDVPTETHRDMLKSFLASTNPPRPIHLGVRVSPRDETAAEGAP